MDQMHDLQIVAILAVGFLYASLFGYIAYRLKLPTILGFLFAGFLIGPYSPGFVADISTARKLAEIGVILMMFGVGLHFKLEDLISVKRIAIPGALGQTAVATLVGALLIVGLGWSLQMGLIVGLSIAVASTVVLVRILDDNHLLKSPEGHISVGWLVVEDILTVIILLLLPAFQTLSQGTEGAVLGLVQAICVTLIKFGALVLIMFTVGSKLTTYILYQVTRTRSQELFTLSLLALIFVIAIGSAALFDTSIALGAFIAGMVIGKTHVGHQASANSLSMKDAFVVIFFLSVGMIFNPSVIVEEFPLFIGTLAVIMLVKPLTALFIAKFMGYPLRVALTVAIALAQIGEFSFILSEEAVRLGMLPDVGYDVIVGCALISISLNPIFFRLVGVLEKRQMLKKVPQKVALKETTLPRAIIVGFGPVGQEALKICQERGYAPLVIDTNIDTILDLKKKHIETLYGDAKSRHILEVAHLKEAALLIITLPDIQPTIEIVNMARTLKQDIEILARTNYEGHLATLAALQVRAISSELESMRAFGHALKESMTKSKSKWRTIKRK